MSWFLWLLIFGGVGTMAFLGLGLAITAGESKKAAGYLKAMDEKYEDFISPYISNLLMSGKEEEKELPDIKEKVLLLLKPEIQSLIAHINKQSANDVNIKYKSSHFGNISSLAEQYYKQTYSSKKLLTKEQELQLYRAFEDAVHADIIKRSVI